MPGWMNLQETLDADDPRPTLVDCTMRTRRGQTILEIEATGERVYRHSEVVSHEDFRLPTQMVVGGYAFLGVVDTVRVSFEGGTVRQSLVVLLQSHADLESGKYKPRTRRPPSPKPTSICSTTAGNIAAIPPASGNVAPVELPPVTRKFNFEE